MKNLQAWLAAGSAAGLALLAVGLFPAPETRLLRLVPAGIILGLYALAGVWALPQIFTTGSQSLKLAVRFGLLAGGIYAVEILLEYLLLPANNSLFGLAEFSLIFLAYLACGLAAARQTGALRSGTAAAGAAGLISTLIWWLVLLAATYLFWGTTRQIQVFRAEGSFEDFTRSGMTSFSAFLVEDLGGAGFFHLLLGPILGGLFGLAGALVGKRLHRPIPAPGA
jgi:hypothetical protein